MNWNSILEIIYVDEFVEFEKNIYRFWVHENVEML